MPGWSWFIIWGVLAVALVAVLAVGLRDLWRRFRAALGEWHLLQSTLDELGDAAAALGENVDEARRRESAVLGDRAELRDAVAIRRADRALRRQTRRDRRIARGRLITRSADNWTSPHG